VRQERRESRMKVANTRNGSLKSLEKGGGQGERGRKEEDEEQQMQEKEEKKEKDECLRRIMLETRVRASCAVSTDEMRVRASCAVSTSSDEMRRGRPHTQQHHTQARERAPAP
jgi:hypothetical protein